MNIRRYVPLAVLVTCLLAGKGYAIGPAPSEMAAAAIAASALPPTTGGKDHFKIRQLVDRQAQAWKSRILASPLLTGFPPRN
jgi:hypothetical protein